MELIIIGIILFCIIKAVSVSSAKAKERRHQAEMARVKAEQQRQKEAIRQQMAEAKIWTQRQIALERESFRQARELEKHSAQLAKHEEEIEKLKTESAVAKNEREALRQRMENLEELYEIVSEELRRATDMGDERGRKKALREIITLDNQIAQVEKKKIKADYTIAKAERKLA